jgi:hypothetical protein
MTMNDLTPEQARVIAHGLYDLAGTDGVHPAETMLVQDFYAAAQGEFGSGDLSLLAATPFDIAHAGEVLGSIELKGVFLHSCVLLAYADGRYSAAERGRVAAHAQALGLGAQLATIEQGVADHLMQQIARIENLDALGDVARELKQS